MSAIHTRRWQRPRSDDDAPELVFGPYTGSVADLSPDLEPEDDGLVMPDGSPTPRRVAVRRPLGFQPDRACRE